MENDWKGRVPRYLTRQMICDLLGWSLSKLGRRVRDGLFLQPVMQGSTPRWPEPEVADFLFAEFVNSRPQGELVSSSSEPQSLAAVVGRCRELIAIAASVKLGRRVAVSEVAVRVGSSRRRAMSPDRRRKLLRRVRHMAQIAAMRRRAQGA